MTGNENIKVGDKLLCTSNEGLASVGTARTIYGLTENSINMIPCDTSWESRKDFRWGCYEHLLKAIESNEIPSASGGRT